MARTNFVTRIYTLFSNTVKAINAFGLSLVDDNNNGIFIKDGGNVGFGGTADPSEKIDVTGNINLSGVLKIGGVDKSTDWSAASDLTDNLNGLTGVVYADEGEYTATALGTANQVLGVKSDATGMEFKSITGTSNQVSVSNSTGSIVLSTPQNIHSAATPTFANVTVAGDPTTALQLATKQYVDNYAVGLTIKEPCFCATTGDITLNDEQTIDTVPVVAGQRVLVKNQSASEENGIYVVVSGGDWTRSTDLNTWSEVIGAYVFIVSGSVNDSTSWTANATAGGTIGVTPMPWFQFSGSASMTGGTGILVTGNQIALAAGYTKSLFENAITGLVVAGSAGSVSIRTLSSGTGIAITNGTGVSGNPTVALDTVTDSGTGSFKKVTVDSYGRVTGTTAVSASDIPDISSTYFRKDAYDTMGGSLKLITGTTLIAPLKFTSGTNLTTAVAGAMEFSGNVLYFTPTTERKTIAFTDSTLSGTWNGSVVGLSYGGTNNNLIASAGGIVYSDSSKLLISSAGSSDQILKSTGTTAPTWISQSDITAGKATNVGITNITTDASHFITFVSETSATTPVKICSTKLVFNPSTGNLSIGATDNTYAKLDILQAGGGSGSNTALMLRAGSNSNHYTNNQITFSYNALATYRHALQTRHSAGSSSGNAIDFYLWNYGTNQSTDVGNKHVLTLDGTGYAGVGVKVPEKKLEVYESDSSNTTIGTSNATIKITNPSNTVGALSELHFTGKYSTLGASISYIYKSGSGNTTGDLAFATRFATGDSTLTSALYIKNTGYIGAGTIDPIAPFHIVSGAANGLRIHSATNGTSITAGGNNIILTSSAVTGYLALSQGANDKSVIQALNSVAEQTGALLLNPNGGYVSIGITSPTAYLHLCAGTLTAAPLKFTSGTNLTTAAAGAMEFDGTNLYFTPDTTRKTIAFTDSTLTGTWNGAVVAGQYGGTGVANTGKTITLGGNFITSGAYQITLTATNTTSVTLPTSGTLAILGANTFTAKQTFVAPSSSTASILLPNGAADPSSPVSGDMWANSGTIKWHDGVKANRVAFMDSTGYNGTFDITFTDVSDTAKNIFRSSNSNFTFNPSTGYVSIGVASPTAYLHLCAGTLTAAPLKFTSGTNLTTAAAGAMEFDGTNLYFTPDTTRKTIAFTDSILTGTWNGGAIAGQYGGTGVANTGKTITLGGNFATSGAYQITLTATNTTSVTLPTSGTLAILGANTFTAKQTFVAPSSSTASILLPNGAADPSSPVSGDMWANSGTIKWHDGVKANRVAFMDSTGYNGTFDITFTDVLDAAKNIFRSSNSNFTFNPSTGYLDHSGTFRTTGTLIFKPVSGDGVIRRDAANGSSGLRIHANTADTVSDTNPGAYVLVAGGALTDAYSGHVRISAYGNLTDTTSNCIYITQRSAVDAIVTRMFIANGGKIGIGAGVVHESQTAATVPATTLNLGVSGLITTGSGLLIGALNTEMYTTTTQGEETGRYELAFPTHRDITQNQVGAKIVAIRRHNHTNGQQALVQSCDLAFYTHNGGSSLNTQTFMDYSTEAIRILGTNQYVGIGTKNPQYKLSIVNNGTLGFGLLSGITNFQALCMDATTGAAAQIYTNYSGTETEKGLILGSYSYKTNQLCLSPTGNIGFGTTNPSSLVHAYGPSAIIKAEASSGGSAFSGLGNYTDFSAEKIMYLTWGNYDMLFRPNGVEKIRIDNTGNLLLAYAGTGTSPYQYIGNDTTNGSWRWYTNGTDLIFERRVSGTWTEKARITN